MSVAPSRKSTGTAETPRPGEALGGGAWPATLVRWNSALAALYGKRMLECWSLPLSVMMCRSSDDLADVQAKYNQTLLDDYRAAANSLSCSMATDASTAGNTDGYAAVLLKAQDDAREILAQAKAQAERIVKEAQSRGGKSQEAGARSKVA